MKIRTTRRSVLAGTVALALAGRLHKAGAQKLGKIETDSVLSWFPALPESPGDWPASILTYADIAGYCAAVGVDQPRTFDDETSPLWIDMSQRIGLNDGVLFLYLQEPWEEMIGFRPMDVDQVAVAFDPPDQVRVYRGQFDPDRIAETMAASGFASSSDGEFAVLDSPTDDLDLTNDLDRMALGNFHYLAASESLVIACRSAKGRDATLAVMADDEESLGASAAFGDIATLIPHLHGFFLTGGGMLDTGAMTPGQINDGPVIAPAEVFLAGYMAGEDEELVSLVADLRDPEAAEDAVAIIQDRIETQASPVSRQPYAEALDGYEVDVVPGTGLVRVTVPNDEFATRWLRYIFARDLLFMATG